MPDGIGLGESGENRKELYMLWTVAVVLLILWALGLITGFTVSGFIHVLLVIAIVAVLIRVIQGRRIL
jgi:hypothetical protein